MWTRQGGGVAGRVRETSAEAQGGREQVMYWREQAAHHALHVLGEGVYTA